MNYAEQAGAIKRRIMLRERMRNWLKFGAEFFAQVYREDGPFHDTVYDTHYVWEDWDQRTIVLKLRRLPLNGDCPPAIQGIVSELSKEVPDLMLQAARQCPSAEASVQQLESALSRRFKESVDFGDANARWNTFGFAQWLASDPQLSRLVAGVLSEKFIVPWRPIAGHDWQGHLVVLSYEVPGDRDRHNAARNAWNRAAGELRRYEPASRPVIGSARPIMAELNPDTELLWVRWPQVLSLGFFWFESSPLGRRFAEDADHEPLRRAAREWVTSHPEDEPLFAFCVPCGASESTEDYRDSEQFKET
jgi:hypothetical protein